MSTEWTRALARADVPDEDVIAVTAGGREIALYGVDGEVYATDNLCTHGNARLCDGSHGPRDRMPAAPGPLRRARRRALCSPLRENLVTYPVRIEDGIVFVAL